MSVLVTETETAVVVENDDYTVLPEAEGAITVTPVEEVTTVQVVSDAGITVTIEQEPPLTVTPVPVSPMDITLVAQQGPVGPPGLSAANVIVGPVNLLTEAGIWVQTGLGPTGDDFTLWIEDAA